MTPRGGGLVALLDSLTLTETITILVLALIVLGPEKLPGMARTIGEWLARLRRLSANLQDEVRDVMDDPAMQPLRELGELAAQPRRKLAEYALAAEAEISEEEAAAILEEADAESPPPTEPAPDLHGADHPMEALSAPPPDDGS